MTKRDALIIGIIIGLILGYTLRMKQVEPMIDKEISLLYRETRILCVENETLKAKIAAFEVNLKKKKGGMR